MTSHTHVRKTASVDDVVKAFDSAIERWVASKMKTLVDTYGKEEAAEMAESLGDWLYHDITFDPTHLNRFVGFYVDDVKLGDALDEFLSGFVGDAAKVASFLRHVSTRVSSSSNPRVDLVARDLRAALALISA